MLIQQDVGVYFLKFGSAMEKILFRSIWGRFEPCHLLGKWTSHLFTFPLALALLEKIYFRAYFGSLDIGCN